MFTSISPFSPSIPRPPGIYYVPKNGFRRLKWGKHMGALSFLYKKQIPKEKTHGEELAESKKYEAEKRRLAQLHGLNVSAFTIYSCN